MFNFNEFSKNRQILMGLSIFMIMIFHCRIPLCRFCNIGVEFFLLLSSMGLYYSYKKNNNIKDFYKRRLLRIIPVYLLVAIPLFFVCTDYNIAKTIYYTLGMYIFEGKRYLWFINLILICYALFPLCFISVQKKYGGIVPFLAIPICFICGSLFPNIEILVNRIPIFLFGVYMAKYIQAGKEVKFKYMLILGWLSFGLLFVTSNFVACNVGIKRYVYFFTALPTLFLCLQMLKNCPASIKKFFCFLGTITLELYLIHENVIGRFLTHFMHHGVALIVGIPFALLFAYILKRISSRCFI